MVSASKLYERLLASRSSMRFRDFERLILAFGFVLDRINGSHRIYKHPDVPRVLNLQPRGNEAKPYQIQEFLVMVDEHDLQMVNE